MNGTTIHTKWSQNLLELLLLTGFNSFQKFPSSIIIITWIKLKARHFTLGTISLESASVWYACGHTGQTDWTLELKCVGHGTQKTMGQCDHTLIHRVLEDWRGSVKCSVCFRSTYGSVLLWTKPTPGGSLKFYQSVEGCFLVHQKLLCISWCTTGRGWRCVINIYIKSVFSPVALSLKEKVVHSIRKIQVFGIFETWWIYNQLT